MSSLKQIKKIIEDASSLKFITQSMGEVASVKLQRIRADVEKNRLFINEISGVYKMVRVVAAQKNITAGEKMDKTVSIMLTSNYKFYGDLYSKLGGYFLKNTAKFNTDKIVIGKTGVDYIKASNSKERYQNLVFNKDLPTYDELKKLAQQIMRYKRILIFYSKAQTILNQIPTVANITASPLPTEVPKEDLGYIFEPEIPKILEFFDTQVTTLLLEQTFFESELARLAARLISMSSAEDNADEFLKKEQGLLASAKKTLNNIRLLETLTPQIVRKEKHDRNYK